MKRLKKTVSLAVISAFVLASPFGMEVKAEEKVEKNDKVRVEIKITNEKEKVEKAKDDVEKKKDLEEKVKEAIKNENKELEKELKKQIKEIRMELKKIIKSKYTQEELDALKAAIESLEKANADIKAIPVENIITEKMNLKFDTPPVIKQGRTLIPVRAISEGFGADVEWNKDEQKVIITKGDIEIVLQLADGKAFVNGEEKTIDVPAQLMNNRTIVPLRFIAENLGLKVDYDADEQIIDIQEDEDTATEDTTTDENTQVSNEDKIEVQDVNEDKIKVEDADTVENSEVETNNEVVSE